MTSNQSDHNLDVKKMSRTALEHDSNSESIPHNSEEKIIHLKPINSEMRSVGSDWNSENTQSLLQSSDNEVLPIDIERKCTDHSADRYITSQSSQSKGATSSQLSHQSCFESNEKETALTNLDLGITTSINNLSEIVLDDSLQNQSLHEKRSPSKLVSVDRYSHCPLPNKKIKTDVSTKMYQIQSDYCDEARTDTCHDISSIKATKILNCEFQNEGTCIENDVLSIIPSSQLEMNSISLSVQTIHLRKEREPKKLELLPDEIGDCQISSSISDKNGNNLILKFTKNSNQLDMAQNKVCEAKISSMEPNEDRLKNFAIVEDSCILKNKECVEGVNKTERGKAVLDMGTVSDNSPPRLQYLHGLSTTMLDSCSDADSYSDSEDNTESVINTDSSSSDTETNLLVDKFRAIRKQSSTNEGYSKLLQFQKMLFESERLKTFLKNGLICNHKESSVNLVHKLKCDYKEPILSLKLAVFNDAHYLVIQLLTRIEVWQEKEEQWSLFDRFPKTDPYMWKDLCIIKDDRRLLLVMLLINVKNSKYGFEFLAYKEKKGRTKFMHGTDVCKISDIKKEKAFLCGLESGLYFATAYGENTFQAYLHTAFCFDSSVEQQEQYLGSTTECLHSLCKVDELPNMVLGMSQCILYLWDTDQIGMSKVIQLQDAGSLIIENCIWARSNYGLYFLLVSCEDKKESEFTKLIAVNLTGVCQVLRSYSIESAQEIRSLNSKFSFVCDEPLIGSVSEEGAFIWLTHEDNCYTSWQGTNYSAIAVMPVYENTEFYSCLVSLGNDSGDVYCYELKFCYK